MKLFQQLLVAPAALGLLASGANAADLNINGVSDYAASEEQVTSITQFSDVYPTDWAYQALANLIERYGCVAGYPNGTFAGNRAMDPLRSGCSAEHLPRPHHRGDRRAASSDQ
ncbi:putative porin/ P stress induced [Synechococcus sp. RS9915]|nr:putative porin/ P stress induced [Synechococcus sp. RS9915]